MNLKESYPPLCTEVMRMPSVFEMYFPTLESMILSPGVTRSFSFTSDRRTVSHPGSFPCVARIPSNIPVIQNENVILTETNLPDQEFQDVELLNEEGFNFFQETTLSQITELTEFSSSESDSSSVKAESRGSDEERPSSSQRSVQKEKSGETVSRSNSESHALDFFNTKNSVTDFFQKDETKAKKLDVFQPKSELNRTIPGFGPTHQLNRTFDLTIHGFVPTQELDRTLSNLEELQIGKKSSGNVEQDFIADNISSTTEEIDSTQKNSNAAEINNEEKTQKLNKKLPKLTKREKLNLQKEHGFDNRSLTAKASQRIVYLEKSTSKRVDNIFESNPGVKLKVNEGHGHSLNIDTSVVPYDKTKLASEHFKKRVDFLPRTAKEAKTGYTLVETQFDHSLGKNAHKNLGTEYETADTMGVSKSIH